MDKIKKEGVLNELENKGIPKEKREELVKFIENIEWSHREFERIMNDYSIDLNHPSYEEVKNTTFNKVPINLFENPEVNLNETGKEGLNRIKNIIQNTYDLDINKVRINPILARGLSYYTDTIFEVVLTNGDFQGSIAGGGRYDGLLHDLGAKSHIPAVGCAIHTERVKAVMA